MRYQLLADGDVTDTRLSSRTALEAWVQEQAAQRGLDWRVGFRVKFRGGATVYDWVHAATRAPVRP
jgi:hypothetical protein